MERLFVALAIPDDVAQAMAQIQAGVPAELVDVVQAIILLFLVANAVVRKLPGLGGAHASLGTTETMTGSYGSEAV